MIAHTMFGLGLVSVSHHARSGPAQVFSEFVATFGQLFVISGCARSRFNAAYAVGSYIAAAYWFTSSTSFANPAVTIATIAKQHLRWNQAVGCTAFLLAQCAGACAAVFLFRWLAPGVPAENVVAREIGDAAGAGD